MTATTTPKKKPARKKKKKANGRPKGGVSGKNTAQQIKRAADVLQAVEMRKEDWTFLEIAAAMGISKTRAHELVKEGFEAIKADRDALAGEMVELHLIRLSAATQGVIAGVKAGDPNSITSLIKIQERQDRLLGTQTPDQLVHIHKGANGGAVEHEVSLKDAAASFDAKFAAILAAATATPVPAEPDAAGEGGEAPRLDGVSGEGQSTPTAG